MEVEVLVAASGSISVPWCRAILGRQRMLWISEPCLNPDKLALCAVLYLDGQTALDLDRPTFNRSTFVVLYDVYVQIMLPP